MKTSQYSEYENYIILSDNCDGFKFGYEYFLKFKEVKKFLSQIANKGSDTFNYEGDIYNKKITSSQAQSMLNSIVNSRCDYEAYRIVANQLGLQV